MKAAKSPLDWPEILWEAWLSFEHSHGSAKEIQNTLDVVERARSQVEARRAKVLITSLGPFSLLMVTLKEAEKTSYQATQVAGLQQAGNVPVSELVDTTQSTGVPMNVDEETKDAASGTKRKAEEEPAEESKKARVGMCIWTRFHGDS